MKELKLQIKNETITMDKIDLSKHLIVGKLKHSGLNAVLVHYEDMYYFRSIGSKYSGIKYLTIHDLFKCNYVKDLRIFEL